MSLLQEPDTTRIQRLTVRGPAGARERLLPQLESKRWPAPSDDSWVLVRQVEASAGPGQLAGELIERARQKISIGDPAEVVRFPTLAALLAELISDLINGSAAHRWYWQRWARLWPLPCGDAIQQVWREHPRQLVATCHLLAARGRLRSTWQQLSAANATAVLAALSHELGLPAPAPQDAFQAWAPNGATLTIPLQVKEVWQPVVAPFPSQDPRTTLAAMVVAADYTALPLRTAPHRTLTEIRQQLTRSTGKVTARTQTLAHHARPGADNQPPGTAHTGATASNERGQCDGHKAKNATGSAYPGIPGENPEVSHPAAPDRDVSDYPGQERPAAETCGPAETPLLHPERVYTGMGGTLYLLNFLNRPPVQAMMEQAWQALPNGWAWLYRLGRELALDREDPLCDLLADRLGLESVAELEDLPPLPCRAEILSLAAQWYDPRDLWSPALLRIPAEFSFTPGHLDLYTDDSKVKLELRLAGLDLNPGWLPWLGTVVTFHFDHFPHLRRSRS
ncbi:MAG: hypothetical protein SVX28_05030 [Pseudomonadota bacterium]|nr:hypothetical protein [Pseudomonadota bacterium]